MNDRYEDKYKMIDNIKFLSKLVISIDNIKKFKHLFEVTFLLKEPTNAIIKKID